MATSAAERREVELAPPPTSRSIQPAADGADSGAVLVPVLVYQPDGSLAMAYPTKNLDGSLPRSVVDAAEAAAAAEDVNGVREGQPTSPQRNRGLFTLPLILLMQARLAQMRSELLHADASSISLVGGFAVVTPRGMKRLRRHAALAMLVDAVYLVLQMFLPVMLSILEELDEEYYRSPLFIGNIVAAVVMLGVGWAAIIAARVRILTLYIAGQALLVLLLIRAPFFIWIALVVRCFTLLVSFYLRVQMLRIQRTSMPTALAAMLQMSSRDRFNLLTYIDTTMTMLQQQQVRIMQEQIARRDNVAIAIAPASPPPRGAAVSPPATARPSTAVATTASTPVDVARGVHGSQPARTPPLLRPPDSSSPSVHPSSTSRRASAEAGVSSGSPDAVVTTNAAHPVASPELTPVAGIHLELRAPSPHSVGSYNHPPGWHGSVIADSPGIHGSRSFDG